MMYDRSAWLEHLKQSMYYSGIIIIAEGISRKSKAEKIFRFYDCYCLHVQQLYGIFNASC